MTTSRPARKSLDTDAWFQASLPKPRRTVPTARASTTNTPRDPLIQDTLACLPGKSPIRGFHQPPRSKHCRDSKCKRKHYVTLPSLALHLLLRYIEATLPKEPVKSV